MQRIANEGRYSVSEALDWIGHISGILSVVTAGVSAWWWLKASRISLPPEDAIPSELPGQGRIIMLGEDQAQWQERNRVVWRRIELSMEALSTASAYNANGARWAMATTALLTINIAIATLK